MRRRLKNWYEAYIGKVIPRYAFFLLYSVLFLTHLFIQAHKL